MKIIGKPKHQIKLSQLREGQRGFISDCDICRINQNSVKKKHNYAINVFALVSPKKDSDFDIPVVGTGRKYEDFEVDISGLKTDKIVDLSELKAEEGTNWRTFFVEVELDVLTCSIE